ncbi:MAG: polysaccharide pyruvyl transferase family protein [Acidobacteriia bacterium]|nr:polysaccharide pyruvyl transferase family protein [Terriglobia bacterium]
MKIGIMGTPVSSGNRGVLALGASLINLCSQASYGVDVALLLANRNNKPVPFRVCGEPRLIQVVNCRLSPRSRPQDHLVWILLMSLIYRFLPLRAVRAAIVRSTPWISALAEADFVGDVHGGDSFSDIYGLQRFALGFLMAWTVVLVKGTMVQFPQTYGPYQNPLTRWLARFLLKHSSVIMARDKQSQKLAQELVGPKKEVLLSPDVAFSLELIRPERIELAPPLVGPVPPDIIGLNVNGLMYHGGYTRANMFGLKLDYASFLPSLIIALLSDHPGELWLVPHTFAPEGDVESDPEASRQLRDALPQELRARIRIVGREYDQHEIKGVIGECDFFIGSRMHACIAALSQGIPCVAVAYSRKFEGVFDSVSMDDWVVDGRSATNEEAVQRIIQLYSRREAIRERLVQNAAVARSQLQQIFRKLVSEGKSGSLVPPSRVAHAST